ncbi:MAG: hypothetical protein LPK28_03440 [Bacteroidota bacterium]|nr:hypothetical protein [Bacteroidota bacterium]
MELKNKSKIILGTVVTGSIFGLGNLQAENILSYQTLGSGSEVRAELLRSARTMDATLELKCGEGKAEKSEGAEKTGEHKCGEGKCGEGKKAESKKEGKAAEHKCGEGKCGEGKCGEGKKAESKKEGKAAEHKCGEGKCGAE